MQTPNIGADAVLLLGMHRSGTSAVAGALIAFGLDPGRDQLMEATADNPTGHFEVPRLAALDDEVLDALGGRWAAPPRATSDEVAALASGGLGEQARALINDVFDDPWWVWKDPRASLLLPFWRAAIDGDPVVVLVVRHPLEVARSLRARNGMALDYALALWERFTRVVLRDLEGMAAFVVDYDTILDDPEEVLSALAAFLVERGLPPDAAAATAGVQTLFVDHRQQWVTDEEFAAEPAVTDEQRSLHRLVSGLSGAHPRFPAVDLGSESPGLQRAFAEHKRMSRYEEQVVALKGETERQGAEIEAQSKLADRLADDVMSLHEENSRLVDELFGLKTWWPILTALRTRRILRRLTRRG